MIGPERQWRGQWRKGDRSDNAMMPSRRPSWTIRRLGFVFVLVLFLAMLQFLLLVAYELSWARSFLFERSITASLSEEAMHARRKAKADKDMSNVLDSFFANDHDNSHMQEEKNVEDDTTRTKKSNMIIIVHSGAALVEARQEQRRTCGPTYQSHGIELKFAVGRPSEPRNVTTDWRMQPEFYTILFL